MVSCSFTFLVLERKIEGCKQIELASHVCRLLLWFFSMLLGIPQDVSSLGGIMETLVLWNLFYALHILLGFSTDVGFGCP
jgi:hypothetical protein